MQCPRCGKEIGGYVQAGTAAAGRVSRGCCPHCGGSMPSGYKVGFKSSFTPPPKTYTKQEYSEAAAGSGVRGAAVLGALILCLIGIWKDGLAAGRAVWLLIVLTVLVLVICGLIALYYFSLNPETSLLFRDTVREDDMPHNTWGGVVIGGCLLLTCVLPGGAIKGSTGLAVRLGLYVLLLVIYCIAGPLGRKALKEAAAEDSKRKEEFPMLVVRLFAAYLDISCSKCGTAFRRMSKPDVVACYECGALFCSNCAQFHEHRSKLMGFDYRKLMEVAEKIKQ